MDLVQGAAGAYLGEVMRRAFGATWSTAVEHSEWRLMMASVNCAFNPLGMVREALLLGEAEGWHAHFELDPGERELIEARLAALPEVDEEDYYAPSTRFDMVHTIVDALREMARANGLSDVRFTAEDYAGRLKRRDGPRMRRVKIGRTGRRRTGALRPPVRLARDRPVPSRPILPTLVSEPPTARVAGAG